ncbi:adenosylmethionine--8-amino-7-oxononanoate transaminase [Sphingobacterium oryzagri]|uniref:Adenosylmethionine-8-amino-7-oxononanoate aminotransferase n=1 Tax=Sphingobacterium oryzagri TaxID=3025669 RepID=A0ABY7WP58_9SPHI|nr:adenosylmethionine--8-amino-7-oxononanoate transaminase [Sphingobacterium sp. KACC 22765]WDF70830.1 adenosylmethionine--8-amino-7-oxononanoate transaminase [Sphingobacterium sp. KACC 22765]
METQQSWIARDRRVNWHPYTQMKTTTHIPIVRGQGSYLFDANGDAYLDVVSSWWVTLHGHAHPYIAQKVSEQLTTLEQVIFAGFTHPPAIELAERLLDLLPANQERIFYSDNGSTAVEVALKMCMQYAYQHGQKKSKVLAFRNGYHGDTFGAMSVSARGAWTAPFQDRLFETLFIEAPTLKNLAATFELIDKHAADIACLLYEPLIQGAGGMLMHEAEPLSRLMQYCRQKSILLVQDEVFVGFSRTGTTFAADQLQAEPDIMCFSKGLTGGTMPLGITSCTALIYDAFYDDDKSRAFFHGHSFTASPIACAAALASLDLLLTAETQAQIAMICAQHAAFVKRVERHRNVRAVRQCGTILAVEWAIDRSTSYFSDLQPILHAFFLARGILIRPLGNIVYLVPPYCITVAELESVYAAIVKALDEIYS